MAKLAKASLPADQYTDSETARRLEYKLHSDADQSGVMKLIKKLAKKGKKENFDEVQIHLRGLEGDSSASPRFTLDVAEAEDFLYIRNERISGFSKELEPIYATIEDEIIAKMTSLIKNAGLWSK